MGYASSPFGYKKGNTLEFRKDLVPVVQGFKVLAGQDDPVIGEMIVDVKALLRAGTGKYKFKVSRPDEST